MDDGLQCILVGEVRALFTTGVMSMQAAFLIWGKNATGHSGNWWQFLIASVITLGIVAWSFCQSKGQCKEQRKEQSKRWKRHLLAALAGLAVIWTAFALIAIPLTYKVFVGIALALFLWSLVWGVFLVSTMFRRLPKPPKKLKEFVRESE